MKAWQVCQAKPRESLTQIYKRLQVGRAIQNAFRADVRDQSNVKIVLNTATLKARYYLPCL